MLFDRHIERFGNKVMWLHLPYYLLAARAIHELCVNSGFWQDMNPNEFFNV